MVLAVWAKGRIIAGYDPNVFRKDACGALMEFDKHGDRDEKRGWEIDHVISAANGGSDSLSNLQPLHWKNNAAKGDSSELLCIIRN